MTHRGDIRRTLVVAVTAFALAGVLAGCGLVPQPGPRPNTPSSQESNMAVGTIKAAIAASDPRISGEPGVILSWSGVSRILTIGVVLEGTEPVSTATLARIMIAGLKASPEHVDEIEVVVRPDQDSLKAVDLTAAAQGFPPDVSWQWNGTHVRVLDPKVSELEPVA